MRILVDSNILVRIANAADPQSQLASDAVAKLLQRKDQVCVVPQNIYEFWVVATRPVAVNGLGFTLAKAQTELAKLKGTYFFLDEMPTIFAEWETLAVGQGIIGKSAHDARLVAAMIVHGITDLLTFNKQDFQRFTNITVLTPADVMAMP